ncbi:amidohydrolase family protein [Vibrio comitans]|nr:amidohydrolase family protein [Vibrio comitans]
MHKFTLSIFATVLSPFAVNADSTPLDKVAYTFNKEEQCQFNTNVQNQRFDTVLSNGRVMDPECQFDGVRNVGIRDGKIVAISKQELPSDNTVDVKGLVVAPGFIDTHTHSSNKFNIKMAMMDGVTTAMDYEVGAMNIREWYDREEGKWPINYGTCVSHEMARMMVMDKMAITDPVDANELFTLRGASRFEDGIDDWSVTVANEEQLSAIIKILDENLQQGALCVGTTVGYAKDGVSTKEMYEAQKIAAQYQRPTSGHSRFHGYSKTPNEAPLGFDELFTNAMALGAPLLYSHNNDYGWKQIETKMKAARSQGHIVWGEYYPYEALSTSIGADLLQPKYYEDVFGMSYSETMYDPVQDKYLDREDYEKVVKKEPGRSVVVFNPSRKAWLPEWLEEENMSVASDAMWSTDPTHHWGTDPSKFKGHPRTAGSHSRVLRLVREHDISLMNAVNQLSFVSAKFLGQTGLEFMNERGRIQVGKVADITIFDPSLVKDMAGYATGTNGLPPRGIPHVMVGGTFVKFNNQSTDKFAGLAVRYPERKDSLRENIQL